MSTAKSPRSRSSSAVKSTKETSVDSPVPSTSASSVTVTASQTPPVPVPAPAPTKRHRVKTEVTAATTSATVTTVTATTSAPTSPVPATTSPATTTAAAPAASKRSRSKSQPAAVKSKSPSKPTKTTKKPKEAAPPKEVAVKETPKEEVKKRVRNEKPAAIKNNGVGIAPVRVRNILIRRLNPREFAVRRAIDEAEALPKRGKPTEGAPIVDAATPVTIAEMKNYHNEKYPERTAQYADAYALIEEATQQHKANLLRTYEALKVRSHSENDKKLYPWLTELSEKQRNKIQTELKIARQNFKNERLNMQASAFIASMSKTQRADYDTKRAEAAKDPEFDEHTFNKSYDSMFYTLETAQFDVQKFYKSVDKHFYNDFGKFPDPYDALEEVEDLSQLTAEQTKEYVAKRDEAAKSKDFDRVKFMREYPLKVFVMRPKFNEWSRARALVNKLCTRISGESHSLLACFLDRVVEQYARNGIANCIASDKRIVKMEHALLQSEGFAARVPLHNLVLTLQNYKNIVQWHEKCVAAKEAKEAAAKDKKDVAAAEEEVKFPAFLQDYNFNTYVSDICRNVRATMAAEADAAKRDTDYSSISISNEFKTFCSYIVYEIIQRVGTFLRDYLVSRQLKTVTMEIMKETIRTLHTLLDMDYARTLSVLEPSLQTYVEFCEQRKIDRRNGRGAGSDDETAAAPDAAQHYDEE